MRKPRPKPKYRFLKPDRKCTAHMWKIEKTEKGVRRRCINPGCTMSITDVAWGVMSPPVQGIGSRNSYKDGKA